MKILTTREFRSEAKSYFEMAEKERVAIKRGKKYINLIVSDDPAKRYVDEDWIAAFLSIPAEYRVNPFDVSPSGDLYFADKRTLDRIDKAMSDESVSLSKEEEKELFSLWSKERRTGITAKHRLIYEIYEDVVTVDLISAAGHYDDK